MKKIPSSFILSLFLLSASQAAVTFETATLIISSSFKPNQLSVQSKAMGFEAWKIDLPGLPRAIVADERFAYIIYIQTPLLTVVDLRGRTKKKEFQLAPCSTDLLLDRDVLYILYSRTDCVHLIDLETGQAMMQWSVGRKPTQIVKNENLAWIVNEECRYINLLDLQKRISLPTLHIPHFPRRVSFFENIAYIFCANDHVIHVYDVLKKVFVRQLKIPYGTSRMDLKDGMILLNGKPEYPLVPHLKRLGTKELPKMISQYAVLSEGAFDVGKVTPLTSAIQLKEEAFKERVYLLKESARLFKNELYVHLLPEQILMLIFLMDDQSYLSSVDWIIMRRKIYQKLCLRLWMSHINLSKQLITTLLLYDDPEIKKIVSKVYREGLWGVNVNPELARFYDVKSIGLLRTR